ncbi:Uncharacterised protein [Enterobacter hormaechei]|uniref:hypothetical protein n=1 Tax=Enterobacter hormaechei TaxID=158836 RepID=UPI00125B4540|nr:hypothetical protein [Enterobacter hormaechei]QLP02909.1 hypothetical protein HV043_10780 [Enterobacter hormaechei]VAF77620.1 Uncharacterised protein [Enterobacter hormaechei]
MALKNNEAVNGLYIRVELPRVYGKYRAQFDLIQYVDHPVTGEKTEIGREMMECDYALDGPNIFEQCYVHAKEKLPYATLDC